MSKKICACAILFVFCNVSLHAQTLKQYFDGEDKSPENSLLINLSPEAANVWQIGKPSKKFFSRASTFANALITDTIKPYPVNVDASFSFKLVPQNYSNGILALQWKQKLDLDPGKDGGIIEYSTDGGSSWTNVFDNPYVYNFYGFNESNKQTLPSGKVAFSGTDTTWKDIWLCFDLAWMKTMNKTDFEFRFTLKSDDVQNDRDGWMIDNLLAHVTVIHTVNRGTQKEYIKISPNPASDILSIELQKVPGFHIIEKMDMINSKGQLVDSWSNIPTKFFINTSKYANGVYNLKVKTNLRSETLRFVIQKD